MFRVTIKVEGMQCGMCEAHIKDAVRKAFPDVQKLTASHTKGEVTFLTNQEIPASELEQMVEATGYHFEGAAAEPYEKKKWFGLF